MGCVVKDRKRGLEPSNEGGEGEEKLGGIERVG